MGEGHCFSDGISLWPQLDSPAGLADSLGSSMHLLSSLSPSQILGRARDENQRLFQTFIDFPKPIVAAINGDAHGAAASALVHLQRLQPTTVVEQPRPALTRRACRCADSWARSQQSRRRWRTTCAARLPPPAKRRRWARPPRSARRAAPCSERKSRDRLELTQRLRRDGNVEGACASCACACARLEGDGRAETQSARTYHPSLVLSKGLGPAETQAG